MVFCWTTINVQIMEKSLRFYQDIIGLSVTRKISPNPDMEIVFLGNGETQVELIWNRKAPAISIGNDISLGFIVDSLDKTAAMLKDKGIAIHSGPFQPNPHITFLYVLDPNGLRIQFVENIRES